MNHLTPGVTDTGIVIDALSEVIALNISTHQRVHALMHRTQRILNRPTLSAICEFAIEPDGKQRITNRFLTPGRPHDPEAVAALFSPQSIASARPLLDRIFALTSARPNQPVSAAQSELSDDGYDWRHSELRNRFFKPAGYDDGMLTMVWNPKRRRLYTSGLFLRDSDGELNATEHHTAGLMLRAALPVIDHDFFSGAAGPLTHELTNRQRDVLRLALKGLSEKQIAAQLHRSTHTVHAHLRDIYQQLNVSSRAELMARFIDHHTLAL